MEKFKEIIESPELITKLADTLRDEYIDEGDCLIYHINKSEFAKTDESNLPARRSQGWVNCVSADTLSSLIGFGDCSSDGINEATKIAQWMRSLA